jgi:hypothetical protein
MISSVRALLLVACLSASSAALAADGDCRAVPTRQIAFRAGDFDAWIADSPVRAGTSEVRWTAGGCALLEHWVGAVSGDGTALYVHHEGKWHLIYVNSSGSTLNLAGEADQTGGIVFEGRHPDLDGRPGEHRMRFAPEGTDVRQTWQFRPDATGEWVMLVDIIQRRRPPAN